MLDRGITDLQVAEIGDTVRLYSTTGRNGGIVDYLVGANGATQVSSSVIFAPSITGIVSESLVLTDTAGALSLMVGAQSNSVIGFGVTASGLSTQATQTVRQMQTQAAAFAQGHLDALVRIAGSPGPMFPGAFDCEQIVDLVEVSVAGRDFLLTACATTNGVSAFVRDPVSGMLTQTDHAGAATGVGIHAPTAMEVVTVGGQTFVLLAASATSSISVMQLTSAGALIPLDHAIDTAATRFEGVQSLAVASAGERVFVVAGGADNGITLFTLLPDGTLVALESIGDTATTSMHRVTAISAAVSGSQLNVFVGSQNDTGITQFGIDLSTLGTVRRGTAAAEVLTGGALSDMLIANGTNDTLNGGAGDDMLVVGRGQTTMTGGSGRDILVIGAEATRVLITDFNRLEDRLDLSDLPMLRSTGQLQWTPTASGATLVYRGITVDLRSHNGAPLSLGDIFPNGFLWADRFPFEARPLASTGISLRGTIAADRLVGTEHGDTLEGAGGADTLYGGAGDDSISGGAQDDLIQGGAGNDLLLGESGFDLIYGGDGNDTIYGDTAADTLHGDAGEDVIFGGSSADLLYGGADSDTLRGGTSGDTLYGGGNNDVLAGNDGDDLLHGDGGFDVLHGGRGNDTLYGDTASDTLYGGIGADSLFGGSSADLIHGGADADTIYGGTSDDTVYGGAQNDLIFGEQGDDSLAGDGGFDVIDGGDGNDTIDGGSASDTLHGGAGEDVIVGGSSADLIYGGTENDTIRGGTSNDTVFGGAHNDVIHGDGGDDSLMGDTGADLIFGGAGEDTVYGGTGRDTVHGGVDADLIFGGDGNDSLMGDDGADTVLGDLGNDTLDGGAGNDWLSGGAGDDWVRGGSGNDTLRGGSGSDTLQGGTGADVFEFFRDHETGRIMDFNRTEGDRLRLDDWIWFNVGTLTTQQVVSRFGMMDADGNVVLDFTGIGGNLIVLEGYADLGTLANAIDIM